MKKFLLPALAAALLLAATAVAAPLDAFKGMKGTLDIAGGTAHIPVMKEAAKRIMTANPDIRITVAGGGSGVGVQQVGEGLVQIGNTGRPLKDKEIEKFGLKTFPFAIDGVALVVNPANNVSDITAQQAADIYNGKITNWKELGGTDAPITLYTREDGSGTREVFVERALNKGSIVQSANVVNSNGVPSQENASNGTYKVTRLLFMNTKGAPEGITKAFIDYIYTPEGTEIIKKSGYIPTGRQ